MDWYYASNGQRSGPVSEAELDALARSGAITPSTLVWRDGLASWQPFSTLRGSASSTVLSPKLVPPVIEQHRCVECQRPFASNDLLRYENVFVCAGCKPSFFQKLQEGITPGVAIWRSDRFLVLRHDAVLPPRCVKCNAPQYHDTVKRKLFWHPPWIYVLIPAGVLVYLIVASIIGKRAVVQVGLCQEHRRTRLRGLLVAWLLFVLSMTGLICAFPYASLYLGLASLAVLLATGVYAFVRLQIVTPKKIDDRFVWLKGVTPEYLGAFPEFPHR